MTKEKSILNSFVVWLFTIAMAVNIGFASINLIDVFFTKNELVYAGKFLEEVKGRVDSQGLILLETNQYKIMVTTNEYFDKQQGKTND